MASILIIDDSRTSRKVLKELVKEAGHTVVGEAENGEEGLLKFKQLRPDIVTLDITMPVMNGLEALACIKKEDPNVKVIMITAAGQKEKIVQAIKYGADEFIAKPYEQEQLIDTIRRMAED